MPFLLVRFITRALYRRRKAIKKVADKVIEAKEAQPSAKTTKRKKTSTDYAIEFLIKVAITIAVVVVLCVFVVGIHVNHGNSSYPMIKDGDLVITFKFGQLNQGDEICYKADGEKKFGRIVAKAGDAINITDSYVMVNGFGLTEDVVYPTSADGSLIAFPYTVGNGSVFVLNDFRKDVKDSRPYGAIPLKDCEGKVVLVLRRRGI
jgi:signal peptidase I